MKIKEYLHSLISRRKSSSSSKSPKIKSHQGSISSTDGHYEVCGYEDPNKLILADQPARTEVLLNRHAQLINTIVGIRSQQDCRIIPQSNVLSNRNYSSTLATSNPRREYHQQTSSNNSLANKTRQRSKIRTNPWIKTARISQTESSMYNPTISSGLTHSESFPQTISNGNPINVLLHQSDSGHGFSLASSRMIDSSSADNTSSDGPILDERRGRLPRTNPSEHKRRNKKPVQTRYQRPSNSRSTTSPKKYRCHSRSSSPRVHHDHFSTQFEEIVENERFNRRSSPSRKSPFILPLDQTDIEPSSSMGFSTTGTLRKTNSHTILKHIEEIENEIRMMKNLNLDADEQIFSPNHNERQSIHEQVDLWIDQCLTTSKTPPPMVRPHHECTLLSNTIKDCFGCVYSDKHHQTTSLPKPPKKTEIMTAFYLTSMSTTQQPVSTTIKQSSSAPFAQPDAKDWGSIHECPF